MGLPSPRHLWLRLKLAGMNSSAATHPISNQDEQGRKDAYNEPAEFIGVLGAGGQAMELSGYLTSSIQFYAVDREYLTGNGANLVDILGPTPEQRSLEVVCAIGAPGLKQRTIEKWSGTRFATVIAEATFIALQRVSIGKGSIIAPKAVVMAGSTIGDHVLINTGAIVSHDTTIRSYSTISPGVTIGGGVRIGEGAFIGIGATIKNGVTIGDGAVVGAGAVVLEDVEQLDVVAGVPAKRLRRANSWLEQI